MYKIINWFWLLVTNLICNFRHFRYIYIYIFRADILSKTGIFKKLTKNLVIIASSLWTRHSIKKNYRWTFSLTWAPPGLHTFKFWWTPVPDGPLTPDLNVPHVSPGTNGITFSDFDWINHTWNLGSLLSISGL